MTRKAARNDQILDRETKLRTCFVRRNPSRRFRRIIKESLKIIDTRVGPPASRRLRQSASPRLKSV